MTRICPLYLCKGFSLFDSLALCSWRLDNQTSLNRLSFILIFSSGVLRSLFAARLFILNLLFINFYELVCIYSETKRQRWAVVSGIHRHDAWFWLYILSCTWLCLSRKTTGVVCKRDPTLKPYHWWNKMGKKSHHSHMDNGKYWIILYPIAPFYICIIPYSYTISL